MSFALPSVKTKPELPQQFQVKGSHFEVPDVMTYGLNAARNNIDDSHPLIYSERQYHKQKDQLNMNMLRNIQGLHAPLRIAMETKAVKKVGRLPFLPSSNVALESLTGRDIEIDPSDIFNVPEFVEVAGQPHAVVERSLGLL